MKTSTPALCLRLRTLALSAALLASVSFSVAETPDTEGHQRPNPKKVPLMAATILKNSEEPASTLACISTVAPSQHMALYHEGTWAARVELLLKMKDGSLLSPSESSMPVEVKDAEGKTLTCVAKFSEKEDGSVAVSLLLPQKPQGGRITWEASSFPVRSRQGGIGHANDRRNQSRLLEELGGGRHVSHVRPQNAREGEVLRRFQV